MRFTGALACEILHKDKFALDYLLEGRQKCDNAPGARLRYLVR